MTAPVTVIPTGTANIASVMAAFNRLGARPVLATNPEVVEEARRVVLPGVGAFAPAMEQIDQIGMRSVVARRVEEGRPTLAICLGMQLLCSDSDESPGHPGLGVISESITRFGTDLRVPQLGWNQVVPAAGSRFLRHGWAYFANSFKLSQVPDGWQGALTDYGGRFVSALERGDVLACQFHPELSGSWGAGLLDRWLTETGERV